MKKTTQILTVLILTITLAAAPLTTAKAAPIVTITLVNPPEGEVLHLNVGESHTFIVNITSDTPFILAMALTNSYYPGKGAAWHPSSDRAIQSTSATLRLTVVGKKATAGLPAVCGWPDPSSACLQEGSAPQAIEAGVRFKGGTSIGQVFTFTVSVP